MKKVTNKNEYDQLIEKATECLEWYEKNNFDDKIYNLTLDNGDKLKISFGPGTIAHLLGFNTEYLKSTGVFPKNSYDILKMICNDSYRLYNMVNHGNLTYDSFISNYAEEKMESFTNVCGINLYDIDFVCKYSKEYSYITGYPQLEADYYIGYRIGDILHVIGFVKNGGYYYPMTNRYIDFKDEEEMEFLKQLLEKQVITMPVSSNMYFKKGNSYSNTIYLYDQKKPQKIKTISDYAKEYKAIVDVSVGYGYAIEKLLKQYNSKNTTTPLLSKVFNSIEKRLYINVKEIENEFGTISEDVLELINRYNKSVNRDVTAALDEHTKNVQEENAHLKNEKQKHIEELDELRRELLEAKCMIETLEQENSEYKVREEETVEAMKRIYKL